MEDWHEAFEIYQNLIRNSTDSFEQERITNFVACAAMISQFDDHVPENVRLNDIQGSMPEAAFNAACFHTGLKVRIFYLYKFNI